MPNPTFTGLLGEWLAGASEEVRTWHERGCGGCYPATEEVTPLDVYYQLNRQSFQGSVDGMLDADRLRALILRRLDGASSPLPMVLHCPDCGTQHIDAPEPETGWTNPPHKSHTCHGCGTVWRPADVETFGVAAIETRGSRDTWNGKENAARRLDGAERARATVRWYLESDECSGSIYDNPATREALTKVLEALNG